MPLIQYTPIEKAAILLAEFLQEGKPIDWTGIDIKKSTIQKALTTLEIIGFISRQSQSIEFLPEGREFVLNLEKRPSLFAQGALKIESFKVFIEILEDFGDTPQALLQLATALREKLGTEWTDGTAEVYTKIMLDWARHAGLAPIYCRGRTGLIKKGQPATAQYTTASLFSEVDMD